MPSLIEAIIEHDVSTRAQLRTSLTELQTFLVNHKTTAHLDKLETDVLQQLQKLRNISENQITTNHLMELKELLGKYVIEKRQQLDDLWNKPKGLAYYMSKHAYLKPEHYASISHLHNTRVTASEAIKLIDVLVAPQSFHSTPPVA